MLIWSIPRRPRAVALLALLALVGAAALSLPVAPVAGQAADAGPKLVLAFYYMWYGPQTFDPATMPDLPVRPYISNHPDVIARQVGEAKAAGIDAFISSWEGTGTETDQNFPKLLDAAAAQGFAATLYFETNFAKRHGDVPGQLRAALSHAGHPAFLRWNGKPVVFFWQPAAYGDAAAWRELRRQIDPGNTQIWSVDTTDASYLDAFDSVHLFSGGKWNATTDVAQVDAQWSGIVSAYNRAHGTSRIWAAGVIPGWDESRLQRNPVKVFPRRDGALYADGWNAAIASRPTWITITSYNEWFEDTQIEPSATYGTRYLDLTRQFAGQWKGSPPTPQPVSGCTPGTAFPQTGHSICAQMEPYWRQYGGLAQFGYPITDPLGAVNTPGGKLYTVQYFERARFELHPENAGTPYAVLLGLLGSQFHPPDGPVAPLTHGRFQFFPETGHNVSPTFYAYWQAHGGLFVNGYPISEEFPERNAADGQTYTVQYFQRARFELHPANAPPYNVLLGFLGRQAWAVEASRR